MLYTQVPDMCNMIVHCRVLHTVAEEATESYVFCGATYIAKLLVMYHYIIVRRVIYIILT